MEIVRKKIADLIGAEYNPRELTTKQYEGLSDSLKRFGVVDPVLVNINQDRKNIIIGGHQRTRVWKDLGNTEIDCVELDLTLEQEKELNIRLNKNTGQFDMDMLANNFDVDDLISYGFEETDFSFQEIEEVDEPKDLSDDLKETFEVIVECQDEDDLEMKYNELIEGGYKCRVLTL